MLAIVDRHGCYGGCSGSKEGVGEFRRPLFSSLLETRADEAFMTCRAVSPSLSSLLSELTILCVVFGSAKESHGGSSCLPRFEFYFCGACLRKTKLCLAKGLLLSMSP